MYENCDNTETRNRTKYNYDAMNRLTTETYPGGVYVFGYDGNNENGIPLSNFGISTSNALGRLSLTSNQANEGQAFGYDSMGRVTIETEFLPATGAWNTIVDAGYDLAGNMVSLTYPDGRVVSQSFDGANRLTGVQYADWGSQPVGTSYYSASAFAPPGQTTSAALGNGVNMTAGFNDRQDITSLGYSNPSGTIWSRQYSWDKNASNLLLSVDGVSGYGRQYTYDTLNRLATAQDIAVNNPGSTKATGTVTISGFDQYGNDQCHKGQQGCQYFYDFGTVTIAVDGMIATVNYQQGSTTSTIAAGLASIVNGNSQWPVTASASSGVITLTSKNGGPDSNYSLSASVTYDTYNFTQASFSATPSGSSLTGGSGSPPSGGLNETYSYDPFGNLTQSGNFPFSQSFNTFNQISTYSYDSNGDQNTDINNDSLAFDANGMLSSVAGGAETYIYDAGGNRVQVYNSAATDYIYFGGMLIATLNGGNYSDMIHAGGSLLAEVGGTEGAQPTYRVLEYLNTFQGDAPTTGSISNSVGYVPYGQTLSGATTDPFGFAGLQWDSTTATWHAAFRQFSPQQGRWQSPDPYDGSYDLDDPQSLNRYAYVEGRPMWTADPSGLDGGVGGVFAACGPAGGEGGVNPFADLACGFAWLFGGLFGGGSDFHGSLKPRPSTNPWDDKFGVPYPGLTVGIQEAFGLPTMADVAGPIFDANRVDTISAYHPGQFTCFLKGAWSAGADFTGLSMVAAGDVDNFRVRGDWQHPMGLGIEYAPDPTAPPDSALAALLGYGNDAVEKGAGLVDDLKALRYGIWGEARSAGMRMSWGEFTHSVRVVGKNAGRISAALAIWAGYEKYGRCRGF